MGSAYGIAAHILEHGYLTAQGRFIDGRTEWSEVMVVAHALKLTGLSIEEEPFLGDIFYAADTENSLISVNQNLSVEKPGYRLVQNRSLRRP